MQQLEYRTFDSLMASVEDRLEQYANTGLINSRKYIKSARYVNSDLGIKLNRQGEVCINVENYRADLPEDLLSIITLVAVSVDQCDYTSLIDWQSKKLKYWPLSATYRSYKKFEHYSANKRWRNTEYEVDVSDREMTFNFKEGEVYMVYVKDMVDEEGNLLVLDHSLVNPYYESYLTADILKDIYYNKQADTYQLYVNERDAVLPFKRAKAVEIVTFPGYRKMKENAKRIEQEWYNKFVKDFI
jgi:hypothetical protein